MNVVKLTKDKVLKDISNLPENYKTADVDRLINKYVKNKADSSALRPYILRFQELHRIYYFVALKQLKSAEERMEFIHNNLLFSDWWHTDQLIGFVSDIGFETAIEHSKQYIVSEDPFIRRWGYVLLISKLCIGHSERIFFILKNDEQYTIQMAQAWLIAELAVTEPEKVYEYLKECCLKYNITGKAVQKICDSFRISKEWKEKFKELRPILKDKVATYRLKFMYDWGSGVCLWSGNENAYEKFGCYPVFTSQLSISDELKEKLDYLIDKHDEALDWDCPQKDLLWNDDQIEEFLEISRNAYYRLCEELGSDYEIIHYDAL